MACPVSRNPRYPALKYIRLWKTVVHGRLTMAACVADGGAAVDAGADAGGA